MVLNAGTRLGPYEIQSPLGAGGMGAVYRALDTRLDRAVAVKVLAAPLATDSQFRERFEREARAISHFDHPHICTLLDVGEENGVSFLVMPCLQGETLAQRLERGALPVKDALAIGIEIADALGHAHRAGIVHRDVKPANVFLTKTGVKLLDFGLAKDCSPSVALAGASALPTAPAVAVTMEGTILGTFPYMAPEQIEGRAADARTDIFALGCVLYEMLVGARAFDGQTPANVAASVLKEAPKPLSSRQSGISPSLERAVNRCLEKDPEQRWQDARDLRAELEWIAHAGADVDAAAGHPSGGSALRQRGNVTTVAALIAGGILAGGTSWAIATRTGNASPPNVVRFGLHEGDVVLSPDGRSLAFVGYDEGGPRIWIRGLDSLDARLVPGTEGVTATAWLPDGQSLGFIASRRIYKIATAGGRPQEVAFSSAFRGATGTQSRSLDWSEDGTILYADSQRIWIVKSGEAPQLFPPASNTSADEDTYDSPEFLPDGQHFVYSTRSSDGSRAGTFVADLNGVVRTRLLAFPASAKYSEGRLLYVRDRILYAQTFDPSGWQLSGQPVPLAENVAPTFSVSRSAVAYLPVSGSTRPDAVELQWRDRTGTVLEVIDQAAGAVRPSFSPDGRQVAVGLRGDLWVLDTARGVVSRMTTLGSGSGAAANPTWSADSKQLLFHRGGFNQRKDVMFSVTVTNPAGETLVKEPEGLHAHPMQVTSDGQYLIYEGGDDGYDIWLLPLRDKTAAKPYIASPSIETQPTVSPDERWLAFTSDNSGRAEIYVDSFPQPGTRIQVSANGGAAPRWRRDGKELFFQSLDGTLMAVEVESGPKIGFGPPQKLFQFLNPQRGVPAQKPNYDVTRDGQRFIVSAVVRRSDPSLHVLLNWPAILAKRTE
jgi:Tol biopolymer transport system component